MTAKLSPIVQLDALARRKRPMFLFAAETSQEAITWQRRTRRALSKQLGVDQMEAVPLRPRVLGEFDRGTYIERKVMIRSTADSDVPVYILLPKRADAPAPCVLALHGHGYGAKAIIGMNEDGVYRAEPAGYQRDFAVELVKRGFVVAAPEINCFGEREAHYTHLPEQSPRPSSCHNASTYAMMLGLTIPGMRVWDGMRVLDYLEQVPQADVSRAGVMGISGGGMHAFFSACLDPRIRVTVVSGYFCNWRQGILAISHCTCNFVPGLLKLGELADLAGLIAPRPLLVENGTHDSIFPVADVQRTVRQARKAWRSFGAGRLVEEDYFEDGHRIHGEKAYPFLQKHLGLNADCP
jgi:dienelactone hydrolase